MSKRKIAGAVDVTRQQARDIFTQIEEVANPKRAMLSGSYHRGKPVLGDVDIVMVGGRAKLKRAGFKGGNKILTRGFPIPGGLAQVDILLTKPEAWGAACLHSTGSKVFNIWMRRMAKERGMSLSQYGLEQGGKIIAREDEDDIFHALGLSYINPLDRDSGMDGPKMVLSIPSFTNKLVRYSVTLVEGVAKRCTCPHFIYRLTGMPGAMCKHMLRAMKGD